MKITDPIYHFLKEYNYHPESIDRIVVGDKYLGCLLKNGQLGVCATLRHNFEKGFSFLNKPNPDQTSYRILLNAYFNAILNYKPQYKDIKDIFDFIPFENYQRIVMIGYFKSLVVKFNEAGIHLDIFDLDESQPDVLSIGNQQEYLQKADAAIITSTSISNASFMSLVGGTREDADVFLLGPSTILNPFMYQYPNIRKIFGMIFPENQGLVLDIINEGEGTPSFGKYGHKVYL